MIRTFFSRHLIMPAICAALLAGCSSSEEPNEPAVRTPKPGSSFIYTYYSTDSNGQRINATMQTVARTVLANGVRLAGKENVVQYLEDGDTLSLHYAANGDASYYQAPLTYPNDDMPMLPGFDIPNITVPARWVTFAYGSKGSVSIPNYDTTVSIPFNGFPVPVSVHASGTTSYLAEETLEVSGETIATQKGLLTVNVSFTVPLMGAANVVTVDTLWFAPKLGMFVKDAGSSRGDFPAQFGGARKFNGTFNMLTSYSMK